MKFKSVTIGGGEFSISTGTMARPGGWPAVWRERRAGSEPPADESAINRIKREGGLWLPVEYDEKSYQLRMRVMVLLQMHWATLTDKELDALKAILDRAPAASEVSR